MATHLAAIFALMLSAQLQCGFCMRSANLLGWSTNVDCHRLCQYSHGTHKRCMPKITSLRDIGRQGGSAEERSSDFRILKDFCETLCKVVKAPSSSCGPKRLFQDALNSNDLFDQRPVVFKPVKTKPAPSLDEFDDDKVDKPVKVKPPPSPAWITEETTTTPLNEEGHSVPVRVKPPPSAYWVPEETPKSPTKEQGTELHSVSVNLHQPTYDYDESELLTDRTIVADNVEVDPSSQIDGTGLVDSNTEAVNHDDASLEPVIQSPKHAPSPSPMPLPASGEMDDAKLHGYDGPDPELQTNEEEQEEDEPEIQQTIPQQQLSDSANEDVSSVKVVQLPAKVIEALSSEQVSLAEQAIQSVIEECHIPGGRDWCCIKSCKQAAEKYNIKIVQASCVAYCVQANKASGK